MNTDLAPSTLFAGRYVIGTVLGDGGYGRVFEAQDQEVGRRVALKVLRPDTPDGQYTHEKRERFRREAATVANLQDPHTVTLFDHGETQSGLLFMVFEFVNGTPLNELTKRGPLSTDVATQIIRQVLQSLREAHAAGILHRDLKPENIIVHDYGDGQFRAKLVDFGLAKSTMPTGEQPLTAAGLVMGTAAYVAPEAYRLQPLTPASDLFGLGLVFFEMVVGYPAIQASSAMEIATQMVAPTEFEVPPHIPEPTRTIITNMIRKDPRQRYQSANDILGHLPESTMDSPYGAPSGALDSARGSHSTNHSYAPPPGYTGGRQSNGAYYPQHNDPMRPPTLIEGENLDDIGGTSQPITMVQPHMQHAPEGRARATGPTNAQAQSAYNGSPQYSAPQYSAPQHSAHQYSAPQYSAPQHSAPQYSTPQHSAPQYSAPQQYSAAQPAYADPQYADPYAAQGAQYSAQYAAPNGQAPYDPYAQYSYDQNSYDPQGPVAAPQKRSGSVIGFTLSLVVVLFVISALLIQRYDIRMPWGTPGATSLPPKEFDLTSTDTTFLYVEWSSGIQIAHDPGKIQAAGRCALILDSLSDPTPRESYYVINALEPVEEQVTAYAVGPQELKIIASNCYEAAAIAESVATVALNMNSERRIRELTSSKKRDRGRRGHADSLDTAPSGAPDFNSLLRGGGGGGAGGIPSMLQGLLK